MATAKKIFEIVDPRCNWLVMDRDGNIHGSMDEPVIGDYDTTWCALGWVCRLGEVKVAEFEGKDWTECKISKETNEPVKRSEAKFVEDD